MKTAFCLALAFAYFLVALFAEGAGDASFIISQVWLVGAILSIERSA
ncbi:hypothetical protein [Halomonas sp. N3-2A]|nr:hypothetical protein [Halomonas sp. N3-2A]